MQPPAASHHGRRALLAAPLVGLLSLGAMAFSLPQALAAETDESIATTEEASVTTSEHRERSADPDTPGRDGSHAPGEASEEDETKTESVAEAEAEADARAEAEADARAEAEVEVDADARAEADDETETDANPKAENHDARPEGDAKSEARAGAEDEGRVDADTTAEDEAAVQARLVVLVGSGDVTAVIALLQDLDARETDAAASIASLDAVLAQIVTAIDAGTYDATVAGELLVAIRSSATYGAELERRIESGTLHATLVAVLEGDVTTGAPGQDDDTDGAAPAPAPSPSPSPAPSPTPSPTTTAAPATGGEVQATVTTSGAAGVAADARTVSQVGGEQLPMTGMDTFQLALLALAALGIGAAALVATRRTAVVGPTDDR